MPKQFRIRFQGAHSPEQWTFDSADEATEFAMENWPDEWARGGIAVEPDAS